MLVLGDSNGHVSLHYTIRGPSLAFEPPAAAIPSSLPRLKEREFSSRIFAATEKKSVRERSEQWKKNKRAECVNKIRIMERERPRASEERRFGESTEGL